MDIALDFHSIVAVIVVVAIAVTVFVTFVVFVVIPCFQTSPVFNPNLRDDDEIPLSPHLIIEHRLKEYGLSEGSFAEVGAISVRRRRNQRHDPLVK